MTEKSHPSVGGAGQKASEMYDLKRDSAGNVVMETKATGLQVTGTATATPFTNNTSVDRVYLATMNYTMNRGSGIVRLKANGTTYDSASVNEGATGSLNFSLNSPINNLTAEFSWTSYGTSQVTNQSATTINTGTPSSVANSFTGMVASGELPFTINNGTADVALLQNGSVMTSLTAQSGANTISYSLTSETTSPTLTARFTWIGITTADIYSATTKLSTINTTSTTADSQVLSGTGSTIVVTVTFSVNVGTGYVSVNASSIFNTTGTTKRFTVTTTGAFTSPSVTVKVHNTQDLVSASIGTRTYKLITGGQASFTQRVKGYEGNHSLIGNEARVKQLA